MIYSSETADGLHRYQDVGDDTRNMNMRERNRKKKGKKVANKQICTGRKRRHEHQVGIYIHSSLESTVDSDDVCTSKGGKSIIPGRDSTIRDTNHEPVSSRGRG